MIPLTADEDLPIGTVLVLPSGKDNDHRVRLTRAGTDFRETIGLAARNITRGERIEWEPDGNTTDIITKGSFTVAAPSR